MKKTLIFFLSLIVNVAFTQNKLVLFPNEEDNIGHVNNISIIDSNIIFATIHTNQFTKKSSYSISEIGINQKIKFYQLMDNEYFFPAYRNANIYRNKTDGFILAGGDFSGDLKLQIKITNSDELHTYPDSVRSQFDYFKQEKNGDYLSSVTYWKPITSLYFEFYTKIVRFDKDFNIIKQYNLKPKKWKNLYQNNVAENKGFLYAFYDVWNHKSDSLRCGLIKYDTLGNVKWQKNIGNRPFIPKALGLEILNDSTIVILHSIDTLVPTGFNIYFNLTTLDDKGNIKKDITVSKDMSIDIKDMIATSDRNLVAVGVIDTKIDKGPKKDCWIIKMTPNGKILWQRRYQGYTENNYDQPLYQFDLIKELPNKGFVIATHWNDSLDHKFENREAALFVDSLGCFDKNCKDNETMFFYSQNVLKNKEIDKIDKFLSIYPNPCSQFFTLKLNKSNLFQKGKILLLDLQGRNVGTYSVTNNHDEYRFDISNLANGMYFWHLVLDDKIRQTGKVVVMNE
jgi:hypothetical protein